MLCSELIFLTVAGMGMCFCSSAALKVDKSQIFLVIAEQSFYRSKAFSAFCTARLARRLGVLGRLGGDTARTGDPK